MCLVLFLSCRRTAHLEVMSASVTYAAPTTTCTMPAEPASKTHDAQPGMSYDAPPHDHALRRPLMDRLTEVHAEHDPLLQVYLYTFLYVLSVARSQSPMYSWRVLLACSFMTCLQYKIACTFVECCEIPRPSSADVCFCF